MSFSEKSCIFQMSLTSVTHHRAISILERKHLFCRLGLTFIEKITWHTPNTYQFMKNCFDEFWSDLKLPYLAAERQPLISSSDRNERLCLSQSMPTALKTFKIFSYCHIVISVSISIIIISNQFSTNQWNWKILWKLNKKNLWTLNAS